MKIYTVANWCFVLHELCSPHLVLSLLSVAECGNGIYNTINPCIWHELVFWLRCV